MEEVEFPLVATISNFSDITNSIFYNDYALYQWLLRFSLFHRSLLFSKSFVISNKREKLIYFLPFC